MNTMPNRGECSIKSLGGPALYILVALLLLLSFARFAVAAPPIEWAPRLLEVELTQGQTVSTTVILGSRESVPSPSLKITPSLAGLVTVDMPPLQPIGPNSSLDVRLRVTAPTNLAPGSYEGVIQLRSTVKRGSRTVARPLPVLVTVKPDTTSSLENVSYFVNPSNPTISEFRLTETNETVAIYGTRDEVGRPLSISGFSVTTPEGERTDMQVDSLGRPVHVHLPNGAQIKFNWVAEKRAAVTVLSPDGKAQANTIFDLTTPPPGGTPAGYDPDALKIIANIIAGPGPARSPAVSGLGNTAPSNTSNPTPAAIAGNAVLTANVISSITGAPVTGAFVKATITPNDGSQAQTLPVWSIGSGTHSTTFINTPDAIPTAEIPVICEAFNAYAGAQCETMEPYVEFMNNYGCTLGAVAIGPIAPLASPAILRYCSIIFSTLGAYCYGVEKSVDFPALCPIALNAVNMFSPGGVNIFGEARLDEFRAEDSTSVPAGATSANLVFTLPVGNCDIADFTTTPADPTPLSDYVAVVNTTCGAGSVIDLSISGTDGYTNSTICSGVSICSLVIPGGEEGVVDTITAVTSPNGDSLTIVRTF